ncbi:MAG TPA: IS256 family transposase [Saprospiraceae bacterium]|nr:IS256 family transposase [Saprospiraceae bacterium]
MEDLSVREFKEMNRKRLGWLMDQSVDLKLEVLRNHLSLCQIMINELLEEEVIEKAGERYSHNKPEGGRYSRWGYNPGSVRIGDTKVPIEVPRVMDTRESKAVPLERYEQCKQMDEPTDQLVQGVLRGLSTRDYDKVVNHLEQGFGLSKSEVSRRFIERTKEKLEAFQDRSLEQYAFVGIFLDGKYLANEQIIIALGVTLQGAKIPLGFVHAPSEHSGPVLDLFRDLKQRGLSYDKGLLFVVDGSKGFRKAIIESFGSKALIQRCTWHKRENLLKYLPEKEHESVKNAFQKALDKSSYQDAKAELTQLANRLEGINLSASRSLNEGLEELLTLHRIGMHKLFGRSFSTTNCIENLNSQLCKYIHKVKYWTNSEQRHRWVAAALIEVEASMRKIPGHSKLTQLQNAIILELSTEVSPRISTKIGT